MGKLVRAKRLCRLPPPITLRHNLYFLRTILAALAMEIRSHLIVRTPKFYLGFAVCAIVLTDLATFLGGEMAKGIPPFSDIEKAVSVALAQQADYRP
ncbi:MAG: hypothetical protein WCI74_11840, partial [Actinomycetes bacterium]